MKPKSIIAVYSSLLRVRERCGDIMSIDLVKEDLNNKLTAKEFNECVDLMIKENALSKIDSFLRFN